MKLKFSVPNDFGKFLEDAVMSSSNTRIAAARDAISEISSQAYAKANEMASDRLKSTRLKYIDHLKFEQVGPTHWTISLEEGAAYLENGYPSFDQIKAGLARGAKSKISKSGYRYVRVPFEHSEGPAKASHPSNSIPVQRGQVNETTKGNMANDLKRLQRIFGGKETVSTAQGPVIGKAWSITKSTTGPQWTFKDALGRQQTTTIEGVHPNLSGVTKVQWEQKLRGGGSRIRSAYLSWRTASENPNRTPGTWIHPGFQGAKIFPDLEKWVTDTFKARMEELFGQGSFGSGDRGV